MAEIATNSIIKIITLTSKTSNKKDLWLYMFENCNKNAIKNAMKTAIKTAI